MTFPKLWASTLDVQHGLAEVSECPPLVRIWLSFVSMLRYYLLSLTIDMYILFLCRLWSFTLEIWMIW